ncbi:hypothetical protein G6F61_014883 [Rhizopus arrhizus]|nr:hypothetical protein G6F61_014883 [Rhizopus arrhizus]
MIPALRSPAWPPHPVEELQDLDGALAAQPRRIAEHCGVQARRLRRQVRRDPRQRPRLAPVIEEVLHHLRHVAAAQQLA